MTTWRTSALVVGIFCIGTSELLPGGMLSLLSNSLDVGVGTAGLLVTVYAATVAVAGPVVTLLTTGVNKARLCMYLLAVFALGDVVIALAPSFATVLVGRVITASTHGAFLACAIVLTTRLLPEERAGKAVTTIQFGVNLATVLGIPLGAALAQLGGWRTPYAVLAVLAVLAAVGTRRATAHLDVDTEDPDVASELAALRHGPVVVVVAATALFSAAMFAVITFFEPLARAAGFSEAVVPVLLLGYGVASILGNVLGGQLAERGRGAAAAAATALVAACLVLYALQGTPITFVVGVLMFALATFTLIPLLQNDVLTLAEAAPSLALATNMSAFGGGAALGSLAGNRVLAAAGGDVTVIPLAAAVLAGAGSVVYLARLRTARPAPSPTSPSDLDPTHPEAHDAHDAHA